MASGERAGMGCLPSRRSLKRWGMQAPRSSDLGLQRAIAQPLVRAVLAHARAAYQPDRNPARVVRQHWPRDEQAYSIVTRAAVSPARTDTAGWAAELAVNSVSELLIALGPLSAGSELLRRGTMLTLDRYHSITVPALVASTTNASFIAEGQAIPIRQLDTSKSVTLSPRKLATGFGLTSEIITSSNAEALVRMVMANSLALALDAVLFSNGAGDLVKPPGLLFGISGQTPTAGGGVNAFVSDIGNLAGAVAPIGGLDLVFIASPGEAVKMTLLAGPKFTYAILSTSALPAKTVVCIAPVALVAAADPMPKIEESRDAMVQYNDAPTENLTGAWPVRSSFQTDSSSFRVIFDVDWGLLNPGAISYVAGVTW